MVDNGSSDSTPTVAKFCGAVVYPKPGLSISGLRNFGAQVAKSSVLAFIDADCSVAVDWLRTASTYFSREDVACFGSAPVIPDNPTWVEQSWFLVRQKGKTVTETGWLESMNMFICKDTFVKAGGFNENLVTCEDVDISYRLRKYGKIISDQRIRAVHHGEAKTLSHFFRKERWRGTSNYRGLSQHGLHPDELPSLILPLYFGLCPLLALIFLIINQSLLYAGALLLLGQFPIIAITLVKTFNRFRPRTFLSLLFLYNVYYLARFLAIF